MLANYARIARRSAIVAGVAAAVMLAISAAVGGVKGLLGAAIAVVIVAAFFGISILAVGRAARISPPVMMVTALGTYFVKIVILLILVGQFQNTTMFNPRLFGITAIICVLVYSGAQFAWSRRLKMLYVEPGNQQ